MIKLGLVGLGFWSLRIAEQIKRSSKAKLYKVFSRTKSKRESFARNFDCLTANSYEELLNDSFVDGIILETPNKVHKEQIIMAAKYRKPVFVDKPICNSIKEALEAVAACRWAEVLLMVGHSSRKRPESRKMKNILREGRIGKPVAVNSTIASPKGFDLTCKDWRWYKDRCPGGPLIQIGIHHADTLAYLMGPIDSVAGFQSRLYIEADIADTTTTILRFASGCLGQINAYYNTVSTYEIIVLGTEGKMTYSKFEGLWITDLNNKKKRITLPDKDPIDEALLSEIEEFSNCIRTGEKPEVGEEEGIRALAVIEAAIKSQESGKVLNLGEIIKGCQVKPDKSFW